MNPKIHTQSNSEDLEVREEENLNLSPRKKRVEKTARREDDRKNPIFSIKDIKRFWSKVDKNSIFKKDMNSPCWNWTCGVNSKGYGSFWALGSTHTAHRVAWILNNGPIFSDNKSYHGTCVCHHCDNPLCCNPSHLFLGTNADNTKDKEFKKRGNHPKGSTHGCATLDEARVKMIRQLYSKGMVTQNGLCDLFGIKPSQMSRIINRASWKHI